MPISRDFKIYVMVHYRNKFRVVKTKKKFREEKDTKNVFEA